jgi:hypothetical protein
MMHYRQYELPWEPGREADQRFGIILRKVILTVLVLTVILTYLPQPMGETGPGEDLVPRFAEEIPDEPQVLSPLVIESSRPEPVARTAPMTPIPVFATPRPEPVARTAPMTPVPVFATPRTVAIALPSRSREEIEKVFEQNRGVINALYNKALRRNPSLRGMLVLKMSIEPSGIVSNYEIVSSEFEDDQFLRKLMDWIQLFRFDAKKVAPVTVIKSIDFFPV